MDGDIVERMRTEEAELSKKLEAVRAFLAAYGDGGSPAPTARKAATGSRPKVGLDGYGDYGRKVVIASMQVLLTANHPMQTRSVLDAIIGMGIEVSGESKINALGALLGRSEDIRSHGKAGWSLIDRDKVLPLVGDQTHGEDVRKILGDDVSQKENEPNSEDAAGSDAAGWSAPTPLSAWSNPLHGLRS